MPSEDRLPLDPNCPFCKGDGRVPSKLGGGSLVCDDCDGTGDRVRCLVRRAYLRGWQDGIDAMRRASLPGEVTVPEWHNLTRPTF